MTREKLAKAFTTRFVNSAAEALSDQRKMIVCMREKEELNAEERQCRVVGSSLLKRLLKENDLQIKLPVPVKTSSIIDDASKAISGKYDVTIGPESGKALQTIGRVLPVAQLTETSCSLAQLRFYANDTSLSDSSKFLEAVRGKDVTLTDDELLTIALSYAELSYEVAVRLLGSIANEKTRLDVVKDLVNTVQIFGNATLLREQRLEESSSLSLQLIESDLTAGGWFEAVSHCSASHWKCRLLYQLIAICPVPEVFDDPTSPFNTKCFLHCIRYGAHCQKLAFIENGVPFGQETISFDSLNLNINHCH
ncbi:unnamed protein product, partial [Strongylus vulgaris]